MDGNNNSPLSHGRGTFDASIRQLIAS